LIRMTDDLGSLRCFWTGFGGHPMNATTDTVENLILDLLEWLTARDRTYEEAINAWRTSCPRLPVWEDANDRELVGLQRLAGTSFVRVTPLGYALLNERRPREREGPACWPLLGS
jgi:hypothetical protein